MIKPAGEKPIICQNERPVDFFFYDHKYWFVDRIDATVLARGNTGIVDFYNDKVDRLSYHDAAARGLANAIIKAGLETIPLEGVGRLTNRIYHSKPVRCIEGTIMICSDSKCVRHHPKDKNGNDRRSHRLPWSSDFSALRI